MALPGLSVLFWVLHASSRAPPTPHHGLPSLTRITHSPFSLVAAFSTITPSSPTTSFRIYYNTLHPQDTVSFLLYPNSPSVRVLSPNVRAHYVCLGD
ncbi:hypothetical protein BD626DRAFT_119134 [Schizophyllum amplum]|uniref:Uncharacterized protein n=1 Tax=Schizophyllum amplum TaxID=97359 RepID=A0A550CV02_9AGAR|nr:hypothetical protein BD626DRAFT_119134 [Auriculariopsis ampla]